MKLQAKKKSLWSTFKNAYIRNKNLKKFWHKLDKTNLPKDLVETFTIYLNSPSYNWSSKFWRHVSMLHLNLIASGKYKNYENIMSRVYFTWTEIDEDIVKIASEKIQNIEFDLKINLFKKQSNLNWVESINHNLILLLLYENLKSKKIFKLLSKIKKNEVAVEHSLKIDDMEITQDNLNSLSEYEKIEELISITKTKKKNFLEIGAGSGRTAKTILSINEDIKYVIADLPPAINVSYNNLKACFPNKKIIKGLELNPDNLRNAFEENDVLFVLPHQINYFDKKIFDISIAIDCLHEMDKKIVKNYMQSFENVSKLLYFKVWEHAGLPYSFYQHYSAHEKKDYFIKDSWKEHLKERCIYPANFFQLGYEF